MHRFEVWAPPASTVEVELPVAGLFVVRDGRIALWRDYFDMTTFSKALAGD